MFNATDWMLRPIKSSQEVAEYLLAPDNDGDGPMGYLRQMLITFAMHSIPETRPILVELILLTEVVTDIFTRQRWPVHVERAFANDVITHAVYLISWQHEDGQNA